MKREMRQNFRFWALAVGLTFGLGVMNAGFEKAAWSAEAVPYSNTAFEKAKSDGKVVLLDFHASWCPTCRRQKDALTEVLKESEFAKVVAFEVNYDDEVRLEKDLRVTSQSTLILFRGSKEVARSVSVADRDPLRGFLRRADAK